jgi:hypothetical protein
MRNAEYEKDLRPKSRTMRLRRILDLSEQILDRLQPQQLRADLRLRIRSQFMRPIIQDKWAAFLLSLMVPGAGQLMAGSLWFVVWFAAVGCLGIFLNAGPFIGLEWIGVVASASLSVLSAEHAKRCLEPTRRSRSTPAAKSKIRCGTKGRNAVDLRIELEVDRPVSELWNDVAEIKWFACIDPFHRRLIVQGPRLEPGVDLVLEHQAFGLSFLRFGRLLSWHEGRGYAFSDLSAKGPRHGFPHVFFVSVEPVGSVGQSRSRLVVHVRGKWTARWIPRALGMWWLRFVCREHARLLRKVF